MCSGALSVGSHGHYASNGVCFAPCGASWREFPPLQSLLAPAKRRTIVGDYAPAARIGAEEGLGHRGGAEPGSTAPDVANLSLQPSR